MFGRMEAILARSTAGSISPSISRAISSNASAGGERRPAELYDAVVVPRAMHLHLDAAVRDEEDLERAAIGVTAAAGEEVAVVDLRPGPPPPRTPTN